MIIVKTATLIAALGAFLATAAPAAIVTFAANRTIDSTLDTVATGASTVPGSLSVKFSFLRPQPNTFADDASASFADKEAISRRPVGTVASQILPSDNADIFSFLSTDAITVSGPGFVTRTLAAGSNLMSGLFTDAAPDGPGPSAGAAWSTASGSLATSTSDFLDVSSTARRDSGQPLTALSPRASVKKALRALRTAAGGHFSSDTVRLINGLALVPEPATWTMLVVGFGMVGVQIRRFSRAKNATA